MNYIHNNSVDLLVVRYCPYPDHVELFDSTMSDLSKRACNVLVHDNTEDNIGLSKARNLLAQSSNAHVLIFTDFDVDFGDIDFNALACKAIEPDVGVVLPVNNRCDGKVEWEPAKKTKCNCIAMEREKFFKMGGFNENYFVAYADWDLLNKVKQAGLQVLQHNKSYISKHYSLSSRLSEKKAIWHKDRAVYKSIWGDISWR